MLLIHGKHEDEIIMKRVQMKLNYFFIVFLQALLTS